MKISENTQNLLPLGYLFLVVMGMLKESVFYYQLGINFLSYSSVMDILLSPIATLTSNPIVMVAILVFFGITYGLLLFLSKQSGKKWFQKISSPNSTDGLNKTEIKKQLNATFFKISVLGLLTFFLGIGVGGGYGLASRIKNHKLNYDYKLNYNSGDSEQIYLISNNSLYYFYLAKDQKNIKIAPLGAIKNIEMTNNKMLK